MRDELEHFRRRFARRWARRIKLALLAAFLAGPVIALGLLLMMMHEAAVEAGILAIPALGFTAIGIALYAFERWLSASPFASR